IHRLPFFACVQPLWVTHVNPLESLMRRSKVGKIEVFLFSCERATPAPTKERPTCSALPAVSPVSRDPHRAGGGWRFSSGRKLLVASYRPRVNFPPPAVLQM